MTKLPRNERKKRLQKPNEPLQLQASRARDEFGLLPKQRLFVEEYLVDFNGTKAAIRAGYSPVSAPSIGSELLSRDDITVIIEKRVGDRLKRLQIEQDAVLEELQAMSHSNVRDYTLGHDGRLGLRDGVPSIAARAVQRFKTKRKTYIDEKENEVTVEEQEIALWDKPAAIRLFMQHSGMLIERQGVVNAQGQLTDPVPAMTIQNLRLILQGKQGSGLKEIAEAMGDE